MEYQSGTVEAVDQWNTSIDGQLGWSVGPSYPCPTLSMSNTVAIPLCRIQWKKCHLLMMMKTNTNSLNTQCWRGKGGHPQE